jgi:hypothetical protein
MRVFFAPKVAGFAGSPSTPKQVVVAQELQDVTVERFGPDFAVEGYLRDVYRTR